jgi:hypothetical protein
MSWRQAAELIPEISSAAPTKDLARPFPKSSTTEETEEKTEDTVFPK